MMGCRPRIYDSGVDRSVARFSNNSAVGFGVLDDRWRPLATAVLIRWPALRIIVLETYPATTPRVPRDAQNTVLVHVF